MTRFRKLLLVTVGAIALCGVQACSSGTELNPQPLPPSDPRSPEGDQKGTDTNGGSSGTSPLPGGGSDAGSPDGGGDASDGGVDH